MDKWLSAFALIVLFLASIFLAEDLRWIDLPWRDYRQSHSARVIGEIAEAHNQVRVKASNEIVWNRTETTEAVRQNDSILTLGSSRALISLKNGSRIHLAENTLVVLEDSLDEADERLRLVFLRGGFRGRSSATTDIAAGAWSLQIDQGTEFQLRASGEGQFELEVEKGSALVEREGQNSVVTEKQVLRLTDQDRQVQKLDEGLQWRLPAASVIYTQSEVAKLNLEWIGSPEELLHSHQQAEEVVPLTTSGGASLTLRPGSHYLRLRQGERISKQVLVEVLEAPDIHLFAPLPRDRVRFGIPTSFSWRKIPEASSYLLEISDSSEFESILDKAESRTTSAELLLARPGRYYWRVRGQDSDGNWIPAPYFNELYSVENPFEAPDLKDAPERLPSQIPKGSWIRRPIWLALWQLMVSVAEARDASPDVEFKWKAVTGVTEYTLEIDDDPYFQSPEIMTKTRETSFVWRRAPPIRVFWRVAGDTKSRMGLFSPVQEIDLAKIPTRHSLDEYSVSLKSDSEVEPPPPVVETKPAEPPPPIEEPEEETPDLPPERGYAWYGPGYSSRQYSADGVVSVKVEALEPLNLSLEWQTQVGGGDWKAHAFFASGFWKPKDKAEYPFQEELSWIEGHGLLLTNVWKRRLWFGAAAVRDVEIYRKGSESIDLRDRFLGGPALQHIAETMGWRFATSLHVAFGNGQMTSEISSFARYPLTHISGAFIGIRGDFRFQTPESSHFRALLPLGIEW